MDWQPITTLAQLDAMDDDLLVAGYRAGLRDTPDHTQTTQDYWHGFLNGQVDSGRMPVGSGPAKLSREDFMELWRRIFGVQH